MDIVTTIPVRLKGPESIPSLIEEMRERIARRAYKNFVNRNAVHGRDIDDWFDAERELIIRPAAQVRLEGKDIFVEMSLPEIDLPNPTVHVAPRQLVVSSDVDKEGFQLYQVIDLPTTISLDGVDAEQSHNVLRITVVVA
jgi:HSP20 family molecular chaperone IbpA